LEYFGELSGKVECAGYDGALDSLVNRQLEMNEDADPERRRRRALAPHA